MESFSESYKSAGVDVTAGYKAVELMKSHVRRTRIPGVMSDIGGFGGLFELDTKAMVKPTLVSGTDGVGTKLKIAFLMDKHDTVGIDCVAMCANDVACAGAKPLFFFGLYRGGEERSRAGGGHCFRYSGGLRAGWMRPHWRGDCRNAGLLSRFGI